MSEPYPYDGPGASEADRDLVAELEIAENPDWSEYVVARHERRQEVNDAEPECEF